MIDSLRSVCEHGQIAALCSVCFPEHVKNLDTVGHTVLRGPLLGKTFSGLIEDDASDVPLADGRGQFWDAMLDEQAAAHRQAGARAAIRQWRSWQRVTVRPWNQPNPAALAREFYNTADALQEARALTRGNPKDASLRTLRLHLLNDLRFFNTFPALTFRLPS